MGWWTAWSPRQRRSPPRAPRSGEAEWCAQSWAWNVSQAGWSWVGNDCRGCRRGLGVATNSAPGGDQRVIAEDERGRAEKLRLARRSRGPRRTEMNGEAMERRWSPRARSFARMLVVVASLGTLAMAAWLGAVILWVLPAHDPERLPLWSKIAVGLVAYGVLGLVAL